MSDSINNAINKIKRMLESDVYKTDAERFFAMHTVFMTAAEFSIFFRKHLASSAFLHRGEITGKSPLYMLSEVCAKQPCLKPRSDTSTGISNNKNKNCATGFHPKKLHAQKKQNKRKSCAQRTWIATRSASSRAKRAYKRAEPDWEIIPKFHTVWR